MRVLSIDVGTRNLAYALVNYPDDAKGWVDLSIEAWENCDVLTEGGSTVKNSKTINIERCVRYVFEAMNTRFDKLFKESVDRIIIEKQVRKAPRNLMVSVALLSYFLLKVPDIPIDLVSATGKLKINIEEKSFAFSESTPSVCHYTNDKQLSASQNKTRRKKKAVELCDTIIKQCKRLQHWKDTFRARGTAKKQDDLADCFLQALYYLQTKLQVKSTKKRTASSMQKKTIVKKQRTQ